MNDYDDFGFDDYSSGAECPMCCGSLVHDGICYECVEFPRFGGQIPA